MLIGFLTFVLDNLPALILLVTTIMTLINNFKAKKKLNDAQVLQNINDLVAQAEGLYKTGQGDIKLKYVKAQLQIKYPNLDMNKTEALINSVVKIFNDYKSNGKIDGQ